MEGTILMRSGTKDKYNYLLKNTFLFTVANFSNKLIIFFLLPFYTAFLTTKEYAIIDIISITQQLIFPIITLDITEAIIRFGIERGSNKRTILLIGIKYIIIGNIILSIGCLSAIALSIGVKQYILYFLIFNIVISINTLFSSFLRTVDKVNLITFSSIANTLVTTLLNIYLIAYRKMGVDGYYLSFITGNIVSVLIMVIGFKKLEKTNKLSKQETNILTKKMIKYSLPLIPNALFWWVNSSLDRFFLTGLCGLSYVGMYAAANKIPSILNTITSVVQQSWGLSLFKEEEEKSKKVFFDNVYNFYNKLLFIVSIAIIAFTRIICSLLLSKDFFNAWNCVPILVLGFYYNSISSFIGTEFTASKKTSLILITTIISGVTNIILNILLIKKFECVGAAIATSISYFILLESRVYLINKKSELYIDNKDLIFKSTILIFMILCTIFLQKIIIFFAVVLIIFLIRNRNYYNIILKLIKNKNRKGEIT